MIPTRLRTVVFLGGPLDGFQYIASRSWAADKDYLALPINTNIIRALSAEPSREKRRATSVAIYEPAEQSSGETQREYQYVGPARAESFRLERWQG